MTSCNVISNTKIVQLILVLVSTKRAASRWTLKSDSYVMHLDLITVDRQAQLTFLNFHTFVCKFGTFVFHFAQDFFCWCLSGVDAPSGSRSYHTDVFSFPCLCSSPPFQSQAEGCRCLCTRAHTLSRILFSARCNGSRTSGSCCCQG